MNLSRWLRAATFVVFCDVTHPLCFRLPSGVFFILRLGGQLAGTKGGCCASLELCRQSWRPEWTRSVLPM